VSRYQESLRIPGVLWFRGALACLAIAGCGGSDLVLPDSPGAVSIRVVSGDGQRGAVGEPLTAPVVVEVTDGDDNPVQGAGIQFALTAAGAGGEITPDTASTNAAGRAQAYVLLGDKVGLQTGEVRVMGEGDHPPFTTFVALAVSDTGGSGSAPVAAFTWDCDGLACQFSDASTDADGSVTGWLWRFGDGDMSTERSPSHRYDQAGTFGVTLTITDDDGQGGITTQQVTANAPAPTNEPPQADFSLSCEHLTCSFTDQSTDADGRVASRQWDFGDGATSSEENPARTYAAPGRYSVTLRVTDDKGASDTRTRTAAPTAPGPGPNQAPQADFEVTCQELTCSFTDRSTDADGSIASRSWDFGDGGTSAQPNPSHTYASAGRYTVSLRVTDDDGAADTRSRTATATAPPPEPNQPPHAEFAVSCNALTCSFTDQSSDADGSIASWAWDFGDGATSTERNPSHTYAAEGQYSVTLRVIDDDGADDTQTHSASPTPPAPDPNDPPHAEFEVTCQDLRCTFVDRSDDPDGSVVSWAWDFGDGSTSTERNPSHTYAAAGRYTVLLVATDNDGAAGSKSHDANPTAPAPTNDPPQADFDVHCHEQDCAFTDKSKDPDGTVVSWQWSFGDGATSTEQSPGHSYAEPGHYDVQLTVTDDDGATASKTKRVDIKH